KRKRYRLVATASTPHGWLASRVGDLPGRCAAEYSCQQGHASAVAAFINGFTADGIVGQGRCGAMIGGPCFKRRRSLLRRQSFLSCRQQYALNHGEQVFLHSHTARLGLVQESRFNFRLEIKGDGHRFSLYTSVYAYFACPISPTTPRL